MTLIVIGTAINQLETSALLIIIYCLRLFFVVYVLASVVIVGDTFVSSLIVISVA